MKDMKIMLDEQLLDKMKTMTKEEIADKKDSLLKIVKDIKKLKSGVDKAVDFMNTKFELVMDESKELKDKVSMLVNESQKVLNDQLKDMKEETTSLSSQIDSLERNLKDKNVEIIGEPFVKNENVVDLAVKVMTNVDPQLSEKFIDSARRLMKKDIFKGIGGQSTFFTS